MNDALHQLGHRQRLRERFLGHAGEHLPDYELLELVLFAAKPRGDVKPLAKKLLKEFGSFDQVIFADEAALRKIEHVGDAVITALKTVRVASARLLKSSFADKPIIQSWTALLDYCALAMGRSPVEEFRVLFLNHRYALLADEVMQRGTINHTPVYPREIIKRALELSASSMILVHNHPSGDTSPSAADIEMTKKIIVAAKAVGISVHDHVIIAEKNHFSFRSSGLMESAV